MIWALLGRVPFSFWALIIVGIWGTSGYLKANRLQSDWDRYKLQQAEIRAETEKLARISETKKVENLRNVENTYYAKLKEQQMVSNKLQQSYDKLRGTISANKSSGDSENTYSICRTNAERATTVERLLEESAELVRESTTRIGELTAKITALQSYINRVCLSK